MSLVIAIKDKNRIVLGSDKQASIGVNKSHDTTKIWEVANLPGAIMGSVGSMRASQIIQYNKIIDLNDIADNQKIDTNFIINSLVPLIVSQLQTHGVATTNKDSDDKETDCIMIPNAFLFAYYDQAWMIWQDLSVSELDDYLAIGSGSDVATGVLFATTDKNPFERIVTSIDAAAESTLFVDDGVDLLSTKPEDSDGLLIAKALGIEEMKEIKEILNQTKTEKTKEINKEEKVNKSKKEKKAKAKQAK